MSDTPAIFVQNVSKTYRIYGNPYGRIKELMPWNDRPHHQAVHAVRDLNLECEKGEIFGLLGPNGAGKTTTLRMLSTILAPTSGEAEVGGVRVSDDPLEVRRRLGFLSGTTGLYPRLTAREILEYFDSPYARLALVWSGALLSCVRKKNQLLNRQNARKVGPKAGVRPGTGCVGGGGGKTVREVDSSFPPRVSNVRTV